MSAPGGPGMLGGAMINAHREMNAPARFAGWMRLGAILLLLLTLGGCGQQRFEFVVTDEDGRPLEGVTVYYRPDEQAADSVVAGRTDAQGSLMISGKHLHAPRHYLFEKGAAGSALVERFDAQRCALVTVSAAGVYRFRLSDGLVRRRDLDRSFGDRDWPGRTVRLAYEAGGGGGDLGGATQSGPSLQRTLDLTGTPGARVSINGVFFGQVPPNGRIAREFCPGDSAACFAPTAAVEASLGGGAAVRETVTLGGPGETITLTLMLPSDLAGAAPGAESQPATEGEAPGSRAAEPSGGETGGPGTVAPERPAEPSLVAVRVENRGVPRSCGTEGTRWPTLLVNQEETRIEASAASTDWKAYYDLRLSPGESYCLAMTCPREAPGAASWNPWDPLDDRAEWYRLRVPSGVERLYVVIPAFREGESLRIRPATSGSWEGYRASRATPVTSGCLQ